MTEFPIVLYLPFPPTVNNYYVRAGRAGVRISKRGRLFKEQVERELHEQKIPVKLTQQVSVSVVLHPGDDRTRDVDNYNKALLDSLTKCQVWEDDSQVDQLHVYRGAKIKKGRCIVIINEASMIVPAGYERIIIDEES